MAVQEKLAIKADLKWKNFVEGHEDHNKPKSKAEHV